MSKRIKGFRWSAPDPASWLFRLIALATLGLVIAQLVLFVQHKNEVHMLVTTNSSGQAVNVPDKLEQILALLNQSIADEASNHTAMLLLLQMIKNDTTVLNTLLPLVKNDTETLIALLLLVDGNVTQLNVLFQMVKNDTTLLIQMLQQHGTDTLRWLIGTEDVNGTYCNDYESCTSNILMPDSTCRFPTKSQNSSCFAEDVCHHHPLSVDPSQFYCDTEPTVPVCRTRQNDSLCRGWCTPGAGAFAQCLPNFPFYNTTYAPTFTILCVANSCLAVTSAVLTNSGGGVGVNIPPDCTQIFNTTIENTTINSNRTEYLDHCISAELVIIPSGLSIFSLCLFRYKCAEISFSAFGAAAATETIVCVPKDIQSPSPTDFLEIEATKFFASFVGTKQLTAAQYTQMTSEFHMQVWGSAECPVRRRRDANNPPPPRTLNPNVTPAP
jgi:hypothetical protein